MLKDFRGVSGVSMYKYIVAIWSWSFFAIMAGLPILAHAQIIQDEQISASTNIAPWGASSISRITNGSSEDCDPECNGFTTDQKSGTITLTFDRAYDLNGFRLWNDLKLKAEGIKTFRLDFYTGAALVKSSDVFEARSGKKEAQSFNFDEIKNITSVNLVILSALDEAGSFAERIELREVAFTGVTSGLSSDDTVSVLKSEIALMQEAIDNQTALINLQNDLLKDPRKLASNLQENIDVLQANNASQGLTIDELSRRNNFWKIFAIIAGLIAAALGSFVALRQVKLKRALTDTIKNRPEVKHLERVAPAGVIFPNSPIHAANVATPLSPAGQLTASNLQMLSGPYAVHRPAYHATGRLGFAQEGVPTLEDYSFGTGFLITDRHVLTNRHVDGFYGQYLTGEDPGGIEFIAEKDKDASDFIPFDGAPPLLVPGLDVAIFTLSRSAANRPPIPLAPINTEDLDGRDIIVIGYPDTHKPNDPHILDVVEENPVFAVKRISQGKIFRHSTDETNPYGVEVKVAKNDTSDFPMPAICHNASTLGGNSGSPILDAKTGELLGVHFAGFKTFNEKEAANLAMAIESLMDSQNIKKFQKTKKLQA